MRNKTITMKLFKYQIAIAIVRDYSHTIQELQSENITDTYKQRGALSMKYTQEIKDQCVELVKQGKSFAFIKSELGPNPKAAQRYLVKAGVDWKVLKEELKAAGKLDEEVKKNKPKKSKKEAQTVEVIEE